MARVGGVGRVGGKEETRGIEGGIEIKGLDLRGGWG